MADPGDFAFTPPGRMRAYGPAFDDESPEATEWEMQWVHGGHPPWPPVSKPVIFRKPGPDEAGV